MYIIDIKVACGNNPGEVAQMIFVKKVFLEISQNPPESTCARVSFLIKLQRCFPVNIAKNISGGCFWQSSNKTISNFSQKNTHDIQYPCISCRFFKKNQKYVIQSWCWNENIWSYHRFNWGILFFGGVSLLFWDHSKNSKWCCTEKNLRRVTSFKNIVAAIEI